MRREKEELSGGGGLSCTRDNSIDAHDDDIANDCATMRNVL